MSLLPRGAVTVMLTCLARASAFAPAEGLAAVVFAP
jgi:hypothetical protein